MAASVLKSDPANTPVWKNTWQFLFHKIRSLCPEYYVAWAISFIMKQTAGGLLPLRKICKHAVQCIWELLFLRMAGFNDYNANGATWYISAMLFAVSVTISFSHQGFFACIYDNRICYWLGKFSFPLFLSHHAWSGKMNRMFPNDSYAQLFPKYVLLSVATAVSVYLISAFLRKLYQRWQMLLFRLFLRN